MEISPDQRRKLDLVAAHRKAAVVVTRDMGDGVIVAEVRKL